MDTLRALYDTYDNALADAIREAPPLAGVFGMGNDPRKDPCNKAFYKNVENWAASFAASAPTADQAAEAVRFLLTAPADRQEKLGFPMAFASQRHALPLIPLLTPADSEELRREFAALYPRKSWLPVQEEVFAALAKRCGKREITTALGLMAGILMHFPEKLRNHFLRN